MSSENRINNKLEFTPTLETQHQAAPAAALWQAPATLTAVWQPPYRSLWQATIHDQHL